MSNNINTKINQAMISLDGLEKASAKPFLLTRINAALSKTGNETIWSSIAFYLRKPMVAGLAIILVLTINILAINNRNKFLERESITKSITPQKYDFAINVSVMYDIENQEP